MSFDVETTFGDDYLYFYAESTDDGHSDDDAAEIVGRLALPPGSRLLDVPCGTGRISRRLASAGFEVTGVDLSASFLALARAEPVESRGQVRYVQGDVLDLPVPGPFDALVCWFASFGYHGDEDCRKALTEFHRVLRPGGTVLIETMHHDGVVRHFTEEPDATVIRRGDDAQVDISRFDPLTGRLVTDRTIYREGRVRHSSHFIRLPTAPEWAQWMEGAGFRQVRCTAGGGGPLEVDSWVMVVQATA